MKWYWHLKDTPQVKKNNTQGETYLSNLLKIIKYQSKCSCLYSTYQSAYHLFLPYKGCKDRPIPQQSKIQLSNLTI